MNKDIKFFCLLFLIFCLLLGGYFFIHYQITTPVSQQFQEQTFIVQKGESLRQISQHLEKEGLINQDYWFKFYVLMKGWAAHLQAGEYLLSPSMDISQIAQKIVKGEAISQDIQVTIPEGFTLKQIDARLAQVGLIQPGELINFDPTQVSSFSPSTFLEQKGAGQAFQVSGLEGYLFPDTYRFEKDTSLETVVKKMLDNFDRKLDKDLKNEIERQGKTIHQIVIMASLLEKEVRKYEDRQIVSGIFWKRLEKNYPLESCATIAYILGVDKWRYSIEETKIDSPYNTYQNIGLPPGPICNPGLSAIKAAIYPQESDANFFLSKPDGETVFSKTLEEHNLNKAKYLR
jgi:UPF0755 protein